MDVQIRIERNSGLRIHTVTGAVIFDEPSLSLSGALAVEVGGGRYPEDAISEDCPSPPVENRGLCWYPIPTPTVL
jgi:hypothetical protein